MHKLAWFFVTATFLLPLACGPSTDEPAEHQVTLEPEKTRALFSGLSGVWEVTVPDRTGIGTSVGRLELCEDTKDLPSDSDEERRYRMHSSESAPRELSTTEGQGGGGGMGCSTYVPERSVVATWRGTWSTKDGAWNTSVSYRAREELYPERYPLSFVRDEKGSSGSSGTGSFSLGGGLSLSSELLNARDGADLVFRRVGEAKCTVTQADAGPDATPDADAATPDAAADAGADVVDGAAD